MPDGWRRDRMADGKGMRWSALLLTLVATPASAEAPKAWHPDAADLCLTPPYSEARTDAQRSARALLDEIEALHPDPDPLLRVLNGSGAAVCIEDRPSVARGAYDVDHNLIELRADLDPGERLLVLLHELRHLSQYSLGFCPSTDVDLREMLRFTYIVEADAQAIATYYAWKLRESGRPAAWHAITSLRDYADIGAVFADAIKDGAAPEVAVAAAFDAWFTSPSRVETYRKSTCAAYLDRLDESKRIRSYAQFPDNYFSSLCHLPDGTVYDCRPPK